MPYPDQDPGYEYPDRRGEPRNPPYVVVRFTRAVEPYDDGEPFAQQRFAGWKELGQLWEQLVREFPGISLRPMFRSLAPAALKELIASTPAPYGGDHAVNFLAYFQIQGMPQTDFTALARRLREQPSLVETAYEQEIGLPPAANPNQFYFKPAPRPGAWLGGIDAESASAVAGGKGEQVRIIDLERGWFLDHADFPAQKPQLLYGQLVRKSALHGTSVLGILCAQNGASDDNGVGIVPRALVDCVSYVESLKSDCDPNATNLESAITFATSQLRNGDVLLIEATIAVSTLTPSLAGSATTTPQLFLPVEAHEACRDAIALATAKGITVIEPGGNGTAQSDGTGSGLPPLDMDAWRHPVTGKRVLWPSEAGYKDCGAIMVSGAALWGSGLPYRLAYAPSGLRVNCFAQAQAAYATTCKAPASPQDCTTGGYQSTYSVPPFSGTSAAAAIIAGAVAAIQGIARRTMTGPLTPWKIRETIFKDVTVNTQVLSQLGGAPLPRGMPDLALIIAKYLR